MVLKKSLSFNLDGISFKAGDIIEVRAKPGSSKSLLEFDNEKKIMLAFVHSPPEDGKANEEIIKLFKKQFKLKVELIYGFKSRNKRFKVL